MSICYDTGTTRESRAETWTWRKKNFQKHFKKFTKKVAFRALLSLKFKFKNTQNYSIIISLSIILLWTEENFFLKSKFFCQNGLEKSIFSPFSPFSPGLGNLEFISETRDFGAKTPRDSEISPGHITSCHLLQVVSIEKFIRIQITIF